MKNNWQTKKLGEVCEVFADGDWIEKKDQSTSGIRLIQTGNIGNGYFLDRGKKARYISEDTFERLRCTEVLPGDCLLSRLPDPVGRASLIPDTGQKMITAVDCTIMRFKKDALPKWFIYYSLSPDYQNEINKEVTGATRQRISRSNLGNIKIPVPPLPEQKRLVKVLDEVFEKTTKAKQNAEKNLQNARELFQSVLSQAVIGELTKEWRGEQGEEKTKSDTDLKGIHLRIKGRGKKASRSEETTGHGTITKALPKEWQFTSIESLFNLIDYRGKNPPRTKNGRRLITAKNIKMGYLSDEPITFVSEETYRKWMVRGFPKPDDIFFVTEGHTMGFVALNTRNDDFALAQRTITLQPIVSFNTKYFFYFMMSFYFQSLVKLNATGAAAVGMKASKFRSLPLPFPSFAEQQRIVAKLDALSAETKKLEAIYQQKLADLDELKKSVLEKALSGDL